MANINSITPFTGFTLEEVNESLGTTQFPSEHEWNQIIGGLQVQGGFLEALTGSSSTAVAFSAPYEKQVLGIFLQVVGAAENGAFVSAVSLSQFSLNNGAGDRSYYWWAIGV